MQYITTDTINWKSPAGNGQYTYYVNHEVTDEDLGYTVHYGGEGACTAAVFQLDDDPGVGYDDIDVNGLSEAEALAKITGYLAGLRAKVTEE